MVKDKIPLHKGGHLSLGLVPEYKDCHSSLIISKKPSSRIQESSNEKKVFVPVVSLFTWVNKKRGMVLTRLEINKYIVDQKVWSLWDQIFQ
jgi:hypothetical protein